MKTFKQALEVYLKSLNEEHTIYVLKGFNYWLDDLDTDLFLGGKTVNSYMNLKESIQGLSSMTRAMFLLYENLLYLYDQNALGSIEFFTQYKFIIIENDYFDSYYPGFRTDLETIKNDFESEEDNIIQKFYCDIQKIDNTLFMNFNEIPDKEFKTIKLTEVGINFEVDNNLEIELYSNNDDIYDYCHILADNQFMYDWIVYPGEKIPMITPYIESLRKDTITYGETTQENTYKWLINGKYVDIIALQSTIERELSTSPLQLRLESSDGLVFCEATIRKGSFKDWYSLKWNQLQDKLAYIRAKSKYKQGYKAAQAHKQGGI